MVDPIPYEACFQQNTNIIITVCIRNLITLEDLSFNLANIWDSFRYNLSTSIGNNLWVATRDQQWSALSLFISTYEILTVSESPVLKFNYPDLFVSIRKTRIMIKIYSLSCCCIYKKRRKKNIKSASKANTQPSTEYCSVRMRIILILWFL